MPRAGDLPEPLAGLTRLNALRVGYQSFRTDVARLIEILAEDLGIAPTPRVDPTDVLAMKAYRASSDRGGRTAPGDVGQDQEQRARMLTRLSRTYSEFLDQSLERDALLKLQLNLDLLPGKTVRPQDRLLPVPQRRAERLPAGTSLLQAFDEAGGLAGDGLLVLGEPAPGRPPCC